ncbi:divergent polysaccharide deacetylase family protein [Algirhabdus cladophorae]|uniref:divergent polysaccharide deacetylase family protein n=1 Tax=Algirhabdus cladophorae TaxID=3377108 RepID=UPI003B846235
MFKGFLAGSFLGALVSALAVVLMSVISGPVVAPPEPPTDAVNEPAGTPAPNDQALATPQETLAPSLGESGAIPQPQPDANMGGDVDTAPAARPATGTVDANPSQPQSPDASQVATVPDVEPILPNPQAMAPKAPVIEAAPAPDTAPALLPQPVAPVTVDVAPSEGIQTEPPVQPEQPLVVAEAEPKPEPEMVLAEEAPEVEAAPEVVVAEEAPEPEATPEVVVAQEVPAPEDTSEDMAEEPGPAAPTDAQEETPARPNNRLALSTETGGLKDLATGVRVNRLGQSAPEPASDPEQSTSTGPALVEFASAFENPEAKPLMSVVLIDTGSSAIGPEALQSFPYPLTFAVDASDPAAADRAGTYRKAGFEVVMLSNLPRGSAPSDVEVALEAYKTAVPEAVALLELGESGFQSSPAVMSQAVANLKSTGHGLVTVSSGLNGASRVADRASVPNTVVFRDLDSEGQDATIIRRFLDQAAFKAGQEDGVVLLGRLQPNTVSALILWGGLERAKRVALAPVSAILKGDTP